MADQLLQILIVVSAMVTLGLITDKRHDVRKYGYIIGLSSQILWIISGIVDSKWSFIILALLYGGFYLRGIYEHRINKD
jgi:hypothetical protein